MGIQARLLLRLLLLCSCTSGEEATLAQRCFSGGEEEQRQFQDFDGDCAVAKGEEATLLASLLDGSLVALGKASGGVRWSLADEPAVKSPYDPTKPVLPAFLPDPKDGALYMMGGSLEDPLQKLPWTIPQLVAASPSRTSEGILYSGKKVDTWVSVSRHTGERRGSLSSEGCMEGVEGSMCPTKEPGTVLLGRTEYNIMMYDTRTRDRRWNITYYDYSSSLGGIDMAADYDLAHFTDSASGRLVTLDKISGAVQWETMLTSPVVALYQLATESITAVPFTSVSQETLGHLMDQFLSSEGRQAVGETKLFPTLYVGEHRHGLFAVPSLVDEQTMMISPSRDKQLLLEGPGDLGAAVAGQARAQGEGRGRSPGDTSIPRDKSAVLVFGYYRVPETPGRPRITTSQTMFPFEVDDIRIVPAIEGPIASSNSTTTAPDLPYDPVELHRGLSSLTNASFLFSNELPSFLTFQLAPMLLHTLSEVDNKEMKAAALVIFLTVLWFVRFVKQQFKQWERNFAETKTSNPSQQSASRSSTSSSVTGYEVTASPLELPDGTVRVGNITFDPGQVLGKGCEGTFVYKGRFDGREVAVKRVLAACFSIADREVELLRESDEHPHVVRYFCMEQCRQFRYIALELCVATLQDWVEGRYSMAVRMEPTAVFRQAVQGLAHLHGLDIAHRDIKPANVLLSAPGRRGEVRAMISDFGLCKKLKVGRMSFSRRSGVAGTEGWIAPEMLLGHRSTTTRVDIFSMGCVYYYTLTQGRHPFGHPFHRQANILSGHQDLAGLQVEEQHTQVSLLERMLASEPVDRPPCTALLRHPVFWGHEKVLAFLQEVSDRVDKEEEGSVVLAAVERHGRQVLGGDWHDRLEPAVREDLRKHRSYRGRSVRDLLRAIRNKKHHYRELTESARALYGAMPAEFATYWGARFPRLLMHTYRAMQCCKTEINFEKYYHKDFEFVPHDLLAQREAAVVGRHPGDIHPRDAALLQPSYLEQAAAGPSQDSLVSTWSQLSGGSRLSTDSMEAALLPSYMDHSNLSTNSLEADQLLLPCSRDPTSSEGSDHTNASEEEDARDASEEGRMELKVDVGMEDSEVKEEMEEGALEPALPDEKAVDTGQTTREEKVNPVEDVDEESDKVTIEPTMDSKMDETCDGTLHGEQINEHNQGDLKDVTNSDSFIPKKKNKKRRKHAKKKKPGVGVDVEEEEDEAVEA